MSNTEYEHPWATDDRARYGLSPIKPLEVWVEVPADCPKNGECDETPCPHWNWGVCLVED